MYHRINPPCIVVRTTSWVDVLRRTTFSVVGVNVVFFLVGLVVVVDEKTFPVMGERGHCCCSCPFEEIKQGTSCNRSNNDFDESSSQGTRVTGIHFSLVLINFLFFLIDILGFIDLCTVLPSFFDPITGWRRRTRGQYEPWISIFCSDEIRWSIMELYIRL